MPNYTFPPPSGTAAGSTIRIALGINWAFGDGSDGAVDFDGINTFGFASKSSNTYTLNLRNVYATTITIRSGVTVVTSGWQICATTLLDVKTGGILDNSGSSGANATGAVGGSAGAGATNGNFLGGGQTGGGGGGSSGGPPASGTGADWQGGGSGGTGGSGAGGVGGAPGSITTITNAAGGKQYLSTAIPLLTGLTWSSTRTTYQKFTGGTGGGGGGGQGDGTASGGGGGGGGGVMLLHVYAITGGGTIQCNGGAGGVQTNGAKNCGGGAGGGGGMILVITTTATPWSVTTSVAPGNGAAGTGTGTAGTVGTAGSVISWIV